MSYLKRNFFAAAPAVAILGGLIACSDEPLAPRGLGMPQRPSLATALGPGETMQQIVLEQAADGFYYLDRVCDVFIGEPAVDPADGAPQRYTHQAVVVVPEGAKIKLIGTPEMQASGSKLFTCDAVDRDADGNPILDANGNIQPVIDPVTLHAAKGDAPQINTSGVEFDLNGYSITVWPSPFVDPTVDPAFENIGVSVTGDNVTLTNSVVPDASGNGVSRIYGFGHNVDVEAEVSPTVRGIRVDADGDPATSGFVYNFETLGGFGVRLSGNALVEQVKSVNLDPVEGQGFEIRRCNAGSLSVIRDSHFEGGLEGAFIRECSGVTFENNFVSGGAGEGIVTKAAVSTTAAPIVIRGNTVAMTNGEYGIVWGRDSRSPGGNLVISGNTVTGSTLCGFAVSRRNTTTSPYALVNGAYPGIASSNTIHPAAGQVTCRLND